MIQFLLGIVVGAILVLGVVFIIFFNVFGTIRSPLPAPDQFVPLQLPPELLKFLKENSNRQHSIEEPCIGLSLILHFLFQEHKDTRELRRWIHRRVQLELNDLTTRSAAGRVVQDIKIHDLTLGSQIPVVKSIKVEKCKMADDGQGFEELSFFVEVDYSGGFQISVDTILLLAGYAKLSIKLTHLSGVLRVMFTKQPYPMWAFSFAEMPNIDFKVESQLQGRQVSYVVPLINQQIRRAIMKKHVWPNYKVRNRPLFPNPLLQPSPQLSAFDHIELNGHGLEVTVMKSTRLNTKLASADQVEVYCTASLEQRPFIHNPEAGSSHGISILLTIKPFAGEFGLTFTKSVADMGTRAVKVQSVQPDSPAEKCGFKEGDVLLAINSHPIRNERTVTRLLDGLSTDIVVLVERNLNFYIDDDADDTNTDKDDFTTINEKAPNNEMSRSLSEANIRDDSSVTMTSSFNGGLNDFAPLKSTPSDSDLLLFTDCNDFAEPQFSASLPTESKLESFVNPPRKLSGKRRPQSFKIPVVEVRKPSIDLRRTVSEGQIEVVTDMTKTEERKSLSALNSPTFQDAVDNAENMAKSESIEHQECEEKDDFSPQTPYKSKRERLHAKASEMALKINEGATKISEYWKARSKSGSSMTDVEYATEASENYIGDLSTTKPVSPTPSFSKDEKSKRKWLSRSGRKSPTPSCKSQQPQLLNETVPKNPPRVFSRSTSAVVLHPNVVWGQSLHFTLDKKETKYLNITVQARASLPKDNVSQKSESDHDNLKPTLLGSVSIYLPQIIADCQLTLSNCHCESFALRPPSCNSFNLEAFGEIAKHPGFDPRLCYGNIVLRFRHFPDGLPQSALQKYEEDSPITNPIETEVADDALSSNSLEMNATQSEMADKVIHHWSAITFKNATCGVCFGKIWFKSGNRCKKCNFVCHKKCLTKDKIKDCVPVIDDDNFELLDNADDAKQLLRTSTTISSESTPSSSEDSIPVFNEQNETTTRKRRFASRISSTLISVGLKKEKTIEKLSVLTVKPPKMLFVKDVLEPEFLSSLRGSSVVYELYFEPGNSYNEQVINKTKNLGAKVFLEEKDYYLRKKLINDQVDLIRLEIDKTASVRRDMEDKTGDDFEVVDKRMQALALLMLHYCSGIQDCDDNMVDSVSHNSDAAEFT